eukprot:gene19372-23164_t
MASTSSTASESADTHGGNSFSGKMTAELALDWTRKCWEADWKPKGDDSSTPELAPNQKKSKGKD